MRLYEIEEWQGKNVVSRVGDYRIAVDDPEDARFITAWTDDNRKVGTLYTRRFLDPLGKNYLSVESVDVDKAHRRQGLARAMYNALRTYLSPKYKGISTYLPDQADRKAVPNIWRRMRGRPAPDNEDFMIADRLDK